MIKTIIYEQLYQSLDIMVIGTGFIRQPKWGHLRDLHMAIRHCEDYLVEAYPSIIPLGLHLEVWINGLALGRNYENRSK